MRSRKRFLWKPGSLLQPHGPAHKVQQETQNNSFKKVWGGGGANRKLLICFFFSPIFPLASWIRKFSWKSYISFVFLMFSWTIHSCPSRDFSGKGAPPGMDKAFSYFWRNFSFLTVGAGARCGLSSSCYLFAWQVGEGPRRRGRGGYVVGWVVEAGNEDEAIGRCLDLSSRCWTAALVLLLPLPSWCWECLCNSLFKWRETLLWNWSSRV